MALVLLQSAVPQAGLMRTRFDHKVVEAPTRPQHPAVEEGGLQRDGRYFYWVSELSKRGLGRRQGSTPRFSDFDPFTAADRYYRLHSQHLRRPETTLQCSGFKDRRPG
jgi:hypothetical protein